MDVIRALAMGASATLIGRPYLWALAVDGTAGVRSMLDLLRSEIVVAMGLLGRPTVADIDGSLLA